MRNLMAAGALVVAACGGGSSGAVVPAAAPVASSAQAAREFMRAASDSNLARMAQLWGTHKGAAGVVGSPADYARILVVIQIYLHGDSATVASDMAVPGDDQRRKVAMSLYRGSCVKQIPMVMIRLDNGGWIVNNVDVASAGNPARPCEPGSGAPRL